MIYCLWFLLLWLIFILGGLPSSIHEIIENKFEFWHESLASLLSSLLEFSCGLGIIKYILICSNTSKINIISTVVIYIIALFFLIEGLLRTSIMLKRNRKSVPSLIVLWTLRIYTILISDKIVPGK